MSYNNVDLDESILDINSWLPKEVFEILAKIIIKSETKSKCSESQN